MARRVWEEERLPFAVIPDADAALPISMGIQLQSALRLLIVDGRIAIAAGGPDDGPIGFVEGVRSLLALGDPKLQP